MFELMWPGQNSLFYNFAKHKIVSGLSPGPFHLSWMAGQFSRVLILLKPRCQLGGYNQHHYSNLMGPR